MTQEEKAKAYDEALNIAKETYETQPMYRAWLEKMFPELRESEDERVRMALIKMVSDICGGYPFEKYGIFKKDALNWFKKHKENPESAVVEVLSKAGLKPYKDGNQWCILVGVNIQEGICGFGDTIDEALFKFLMEVLKEQKEQKLAWSAEDERLLTKLMTFVDIECFDIECNGQEVIDWLKSLRPQPHWKPSEEQMVALKEALETYKGFEEYDAMKSLYNDLKKL